MGVAAPRDLDGSLLPEEVRGIETPESLVELTQVVEKEGIEDAIRLREHSVVRGKNEVDAASHLQIDEGRRGAMMTGILCGTGLRRRGLCLKLILFLFLERWMRRCRGLKKMR